MALIKCPDCAKEISDAAPSCINCGRPKVKWHIQVLHSAFKLLILPAIVALCSVLVTKEINKNAEMRRNLDSFYEDAYEIEKSYRAVKNYMDDIGKDLQYEPKEFKNRIICLDYSIIKYYMKTMTIFPELDAESDSITAFLDKLYWGKDESIGYDSSFRVFLTVAGNLSKNKKKGYQNKLDQIKELTQFFDDILHLSIYKNSLRLHKDRKRIEQKFKDMNDDIENKLNENSYNRRKEKISQMKNLIYLMRNI